MLLYLISLIPFLLALSTTLIQSASATERVQPLAKESPLQQTDIFSSWNSITNHLGLPPSHHYQTQEEKTDDKSEQVKVKKNDDLTPLLVPHPYIHTLSTTRRSQTDSETPTSPPVPHRLPVVNRPLQVSLLALIMTAAVLANGSLILNISRDSLKLRMVHFLLIRHVCITDCLGALLVLPVPLFAVAKGNWDFGDEMCAAVSTTTAACWTMHLLAVAFYRADRVLAVWLPTGRYPILSVRTTNILLVIVWCLAVGGSYGATVLFGPEFQPALALCIPNVPLIFFVIVFAGYCIGLVGLTTGYVLAFARRRRRKRKKERQLVGVYPQLQDNAPFEPTPNKYIDEEIEDCEDNNSSYKGRKRRALSDQFPVLTMQTHAQVRESPYSHRRTWSESATACRPSTIFSTLVTKSHRSKSPCPPSSVKQSPVTPPLPPSPHHSVTSSNRPPAPQPTSWDNLTMTGSSHGYERLAEDESSSSDLSTYATLPAKILHSLSFDERGLTTTSKVDDLLPSKGRVIISTQSRSFDSADSMAQKRLRFLRSHLLPPTRPAHRPTNSAYTNSTYPGPTEKAKWRDKSEMHKCFAGVQAWSLDRKSILSGKSSMGDLGLSERGDNPCFGDSEESSESSLHSNDLGIVVSSPRHPPQLQQTLLSCPKTHLTLGVSVNSLSLCGDGRPPDATSLTSRAISESSERTEKVKQAVRKHRTRTRLKHFRAKGKKTGPAKRALASYALSVGHLLLYLPAMFVVGLQGSTLPPGVALFCGIVVYCDFLIQPIALLLVSHRLRLEVEKTVSSLLGRKGKSKTVA